MAAADRLVFLHLSDLHVRPEQERLPPVSGPVLVELARSELKPDLLLFTGDAVYAPDAIAFAKARFLLGMWAKGTPVLAVPGNHDLQRSSSELGHLFRLWSEAAEIREKFWGESGLRTLVHEASHSFNAFSDDVNMPGLKKGLLPGDFAKTIEWSGRRIGVVGLNTVFNHVAEKAGDVGMVDARQLREVCGGDPELWAAGHDLRILLTHFPPDKLEKASQAQFYGEIAPPGRFHLHLCGHRVDAAMDFAFSEPYAFRLHGRRLGNEGGFIRCVVDFASPDQSYAEQLFVENRPGNRARFPLPMQLGTRSQSSAPTTAMASHLPTLTLDRLHLRNFRAFDDIDLSFERTSRLDGRWTCIAGINGAGKSSLVQALALSFLGDPLARELGGGWLDRMRRATGTERRDAVIEATWNHATAGQKRVTELRIKQDGNLAPSSPEAASFWQSMRSNVCLAYGATRNLSPRPRRESERRVHPDVLSQMTVFDPLSELAGAEAILSNPSVGTELVVLFQNLIRRVFEVDLEVEISSSGLVRFRAAGDVVEALDLPDGFRSSAAWLADLCATWAGKYSELARRGDPSLIDAIVVIDEIDLHLHPSLQRQLIPRLRAALPCVQWIVTTHSPLVLSNFDSNEIIALDRTSEGGVRQLDRQIMGFTTDQIYEWLMGTQPSGAAMEQELSRAAQADVGTKEELAQMLLAGPNVNDAQARERHRKLQENLKRIKPS